VTYRLSALAKSDLRNVYLYSLHEFGENVADTYLEALYDIFETLSRNREMGLRPDFGAPENVRKFPALKHVI